MKPELQAAFKAYCEADHAPETEFDCAETAIIREFGHGHSLTFDAVVPRLGKGGSK